MSIGKQLSLFDFIENPFGVIDSKQTTSTDSIKNLNACIPYKGSKRKISRLILQELRNHAPQAKYFYDMFGGGGAMALNAHYNGYKTHYNELDTDVYVYMDFLISQLFQKKSNADTYKALKDISQKDLCRLIDKHNPHLPKKNYKGTQGKGLTELKRLHQLQQLELITHTNLDYAEVKISAPPQDTIIYADPPYANTSEYKLCGNSFDYERFYQWCIDKVKQGYYVFISEYNMPQDRFKDIWSKETLANFNTIKKDCGARARPQRVERLFIVR